MVLLSGKKCEERFYATLILVYSVARIDTGYVIAGLPH